MLNLSLLKSENGIITTFTDTPAIPSTQDELTKAEDQIADEEKSVQNDDAEHREEHSVEEVQTKMEYGTPSGSDSAIPSGCPGCVASNQDAADAVIIDAEIAPVESTEKSTEDTSDSEEVTEDTDLNAELKAAVTYAVALDVITDRDRTDFSDAELKAIRSVYLELVPGNEVLNVIANDSSDIGLIRANIEILVHTLLAGAKAGIILTGRAIKTIYDLGVTVGDFLEKHKAEIRDIGMNIFTSSEYITNYWAKKFGKLVNDISEEELKDFVISAFAYKEWKDKLDKLTEINKFILNNKKLFLDDSADITKKVKELTKMVEKLGIEIDAANQIINTDKFNLDRKPDNAVTLGYTPKNMCVASRDIATYLKIYKKNGDNDTLTLIEKLEEITKRLMDESKTNTDPDFVKSVLDYEIKLVYVVNVINVTHKLIRDLLDDFVRIGKGYEKIIDEREANK